MLSLPAILAGLRSGLPWLGEIWAGLRSPWTIAALAALALAASHLWVWRAGAEGARLECRAAAIQLRLDAAETALAAERAARALQERAAADANTRALDLAAAAAERAGQIEEYRRELAKRPAQACRPTAADRALDRRLRGERAAAPRRP
jgi:F0F1-type ATP synthase membrane subunit b/b'